MIDFGTWKLVGNNLILKRESWRIVYFDQCNSSSQILDWIFHYFAHNLTAQEMFDLINALKVILHPCKNYCSGGMNKAANGVDFEISGPYRTIKVSNDIFDWAYFDLKK